MSYDFVNYFEPSVITAKFELVQDQLAQELETQGISNPALNYLWEYFHKKVNANWHKYGMLQFVLQKINNLNDNCTNPEFLKLRAQYHLSKCLAASYDYCDLKEKWYGLVGTVVLCIDCHQAINACESQHRCARCYRAYLNIWRPI